MKAHGLAAAAVIAFVIFPAGCEDVTGLESLSVRAEMSPERVAPGDSLAARVVLTNHGDEPVLVPKGCPGIGWPHVLRDGEPVAMEGSRVDPPDLICLLVAVPPDTLPAGGSTTFEWPMRAVVHGTPALPGEYLFRFETHREQLSEAETTFVVE